MCGIAALFKNSSKHSNMNLADVEKELVQMLSAIRHRGDPFLFAERIVAADFALGTNRLAIVDRAQARQPVSDPSGRYVCVMNGEIYNHHLLRRELQNLGVKFTTESDTEVFLMSYLRWGSEGLKKMEGIFGAVVYDRQTRRIFAARDHIGIKPLYYAHTEHGWYFASEQKSFLELGIASSEFPAGSFFEAGEFASYVDYNVKGNADMSESFAVSNCRKVLEDAVRSQVDTDLPVAVVFSGGIDSTVVLHLAKKFNKNISAFSIGVPGSADLEFARRYCAEYEIPHLVTIVDRQQLKRTIGRAIYYGEFFEPVDISDMVVMSIVYAQIAAHGFKIALTGDGADEIFAGYDLFKKVLDPDALGDYRLKNLCRTDLQRTDRSSMSHSIEARVPFLAEKVVELACQIPFSLKVKNGVEKYVLREAFRGDVPDYMLDRPKIRMPEGIGIHDEVFREIGALHSRNVEMLEGFDVDSLQVQRAAQYYAGFGFPRPAQRIKRVGLDYFAGGYFNFASASEGI